MKNRWSDEEAEAFCERYREFGDDLALRVYTSRLIGSEPSLVMHGGGNTSVKSSHTDLFGEPVEAIYVKGSGWDLDSIEPQGLPGLELAYLRRLERVTELSDEEMVNQLRTHLFDASSPTPSVETLLHAFLPHKFIDHSHADVILLLTNQPRGEQWVREALGERVALVPYVMPGFELSKVAAEVAADNPDCEGMVLLKHGLFTFGESARESYDRHIELVTRAEDWVERRCGRRAVFGVAGKVAGRPRRVALAARVAPLLRGALARADERSRPWLLDFRLTEGIAAAVDSEGVPVLRSGPLTPDHVIRTKELPLVLSPVDGDEGSWLEDAEAALAAYIDSYQRYFDRQAADKERPDLQRLDPLPRVIVIEKLGVFTVGATVRAASIAGDLYEHTVDVKTMASRLDRYEALGQSDLFDVEYWSLEQAKLSKHTEKPLSRRVALVTGAGGAIGSAIARALALEGAAVIACDIDVEAAERTAARTCGLSGTGSCLALEMDVTSETSVAAAFERAALERGGVDIVVLNAGIARSAPIDELELDDWSRVLEVNLTGYMITLREATRLFKRQRTGGNVIVNASKNVFAPGAEFAAYSVSKAGGHQLGRLAAVELAPYGIRVNMINPDAIFADGDVPSGLWQEVGVERARSRGLDLEELEEHYRQRNLLKSKITADDVARAVLFFAREETPTTGATLPVDGGLPEAFPR